MNVAIDLPVNARIATFASLLICTLLAPIICDQDMFIKPTKLRLVLTLLVFCAVCNKTHQITIPISYLAFFVSVNLLNPVSPAGHLFSLCEYYKSRIQTHLYYFR